MVSWRTRPSCMADASSTGMRPKPGTSEHSSWRSLSGHVSSNKQQYTDHMSTFSLYGCACISISGAMYGSVPTRDCMPLTLNMRATPKSPARRECRRGQHERHTPPRGHERERD